MLIEIGRLQIAAFFYISIMAALEVERSFNYLPIIITILTGGMAVFLINKFINYRNTEKDKRTIYNYMKQQIPGKYNFLSTKNIASHTNLSPARVEEICNKHPLIKLSVGKKDGIWGLRNISEY